MMLGQEQMNIGVVILVVGVVVVGAIVLIAYAHFEAKKRREALAALAAELGFSFDPDHDVSHDEQYAQFEVFRRGHDRSAYNTMTGAIEIDGRAFPCRMGDFTYKVTSGSGKNRRTTTYRLSYLICHLPFPGVPALLIRRESMMDKLAGVFGFDDIDFESSEFSRRFHVKSPDKRFAYDVVTPKMMEFLMSSSPPVIDVEHGACCVADGTRRWAPVEFKTRMAWVTAFFDLWPDHLTKDLEKRAIA
jgi:hypothetical protein